MSSLFDDQIRVALLGSGSRGNCTWIGNRQHGVLIDCGITTRQVLVRMEALGLSPMAIDAVLVTHEHSDHVSAARVLCNRLFKLRGHRVPFYMTDGTARCLHERIQPSQIMRVSPGERIEIGSLVAEAFRVPHDGMDTIAWAVQSGALRAGVITDLGRSTRLVEEKLASLDIAVLEFNHDLDMLMNGTYAWSLKQRIRSGKGHLSNAQAAGMLRLAASRGRLKHLALAHLSEENNRPELALEAATAALRSAGREDISVRCGEQRLAIPVMSHSAPPAPVRSTRRTRRAPSISTPSPDHQMSLFGQPS